MENDFIIQNTKIEPGQNEVIRLNVGRLPSDTRIHLNINVYRSKKEGPTMLVLAGIHGDEINGVEVVRRAIADGIFENLKKGNVIAIPVLNIYGFNNFSREIPDGKDVNRSFPGSLNGSLASRVAAILTKKVLPLVDFGVDFHTGGNSNFNHPKIRYAKDHLVSKELALAFNAPYTIARRPIAKSLRKTALDINKPILVYEGGENLRFDGFSIEKGISGLKKLMKMKGMIDNAPMPEKTIHITKSRWLRARRAGLFRWSKCSGHAVIKGESLGLINDPYGQDEIPVVSKVDGHIFGHNNTPVVKLGDALFHIGLVDQDT
jgi:predicted deacylase